MHIYNKKYMCIHIKDFNRSYLVRGTNFLPEVTDYQVKPSVLGVGYLLSISIVLGCPPELADKTVLLKASHILPKGHGQSSRDNLQDFPLLSSLHGSRRCCSHKVPSVV